MHRRCPLHFRTTSLQSTELEQWSSSSELFLVRLHLCVTLWAEFDRLGQVGSRVGYTMLTIVCIRWHAILMEDNRNCIITDYKTLHSPILVVTFPLSISLFDCAPFCNIFSFSPLFSLSSNLCKDCITV